MFRLCPPDASKALHSLSLSTKSQLTSLQLSLGSHCLQTHLVFKHLLLGQSIPHLTDNGSSAFGGHQLIVGFCLLASGGCGFKATETYVSASCAR